MFFYTDRFTHCVTQHPFRSHIGLQHQTYNDQILFGQESNTQAIKALLSHRKTTERGALETSFFL